MNDLWLLLAAGALILLAFWIAVTHIERAVLAIDDFTPDYWAVVLSTEVVQ